MASGSGGGGGGFDPCECLWSHEDAMQRLISLLRSSQGYCSSEECFQDMPGPANLPRTGGDDSFFLFMLIWIVLALVLYFLRPQSVFRRSGDSKPSGDQGPQQPPPDNLAQ